MTYLDILVIVICRLRGIKIESTHARAVQGVSHVPYLLSSKVASEISLDFDQVPKLCLVKVCDKLAVSDIFQFVVAGHSGIAAA